MYEEYRRQKRKVSRRNKRKTRNRRIITLCIIIVFGGRVWAKSGQIQSSLLKNEPDYSDSNRTDTGEDAVENKILNKKDIKEKQNKDDWKLLLVNKDNFIPDDFTVNLTELKNGHAIDERVYADLQNMMNDARSAGLSPVICSSYRTMEKQTTLFNNKVKKNMSQGYSEEKARIEASKWIALPGTGEHELGLAVDIVSKDYKHLNENQQNTAEQKWLMENSYKYGFILRYPINKSEITGINFEPWHYRYVGKEIAAEIYRKGICLEEYLDIK